MSSPHLKGKTRPIKPLESPAGVRIGVDQFNLTDPNGAIATWLAALKALKAIDNLEDEMSYFRLAAIHGAPYVGWDTVESDGPHIKNQSGNFCTHGENTFPTWHRIYMILFENALYNHIPEDDPNRTTFRLPYWDWAKNDKDSETPLPILLSSPDWPNGSNIDNPLWKFINPVCYKVVEPGKKDKYVPYPFGDVEMGKFAIGNDIIGDGPNALWSLTTATSRCVDPGYGSEPFLNGDCDMGRVMTNLANAGFYNHTKPDDPIPPYKTISDYVYVLMSWHYSSYNAFATTAFDPVPEKDKFGWLSLEYLHNNLHNWIGGPDVAQIGHMNDVPVAALDPIFWLHHCFIDALFAMWQSLPHNSDLWLDDESAKKGLLPFHTDDQGTLFTSNDVKDISKWGYSYSSFPTSGGSDENLVKMINKTYGHGMQHVVAHAKNDQLPGSHNDYIINVLYNRHALDQSYKIHFFLGEVSVVSSSELLSHPNHVGSVYTFSNSGRARCSNCSDQKAANKLSRAQVLLTVPFIKYLRKGGIETLPQGENGKDGVQEHIKKNLTWKSDGTLVPIKDNPDLSDLKIILAQGKAEHFPHDDTKLSVFHHDSYQTFWQGSIPGEESEPPESFIIKH